MQSPTEQSPRGPCTLSECREASSQRVWGTAYSLTFRLNERDVLTWYGESCLRVAWLRSSAAYQGTLRVPYLLTSSPPHPTSPTMYHRAYDIIMYKMFVETSSQLTRWLLTRWLTFELRPAIRSPMSADAAQQRYSLCRARALRRSISLVLASWLVTIQYLARRRLLQEDLAVAPLYCIIGGQLLLKISYNWYNWYGAYFHITRTPGGTELLSMTQPLIIKSAPHALFHQPF